MKTNDMFDQVTTDPGLPGMQYFDLADGTEVLYIDRNAHHPSEKCQPRDITLIDRAQDRRIIEAITIDIRIGQGVTPIGAARGLLWE